MINYDRQLCTTSGQGTLYPDRLESNERPSFVDSKAVQFRKTGHFYSLGPFTFEIQISFQFYNYQMTPEMAVECLDSTGSCSRSSCECDGKLFADIWHLGTVQRHLFSYITNFTKK